VATRKMARTGLALPWTALAAQVKVDQPNQRIRKSRPASDPP
jgi:hypothetical protein